MAHTICADTLKKVGKLDDSVIDYLFTIDDNSSFSEDEFETYLQKHSPSINNQRETLMSSNKKQTAEIRKFASQVSSNFFNSKTFADKNSINIQALKAGKFRHPWWGVMKFDTKFFENMIRNFEANLPNPEIAFDFKHQPDYGAAAWVNKLFVENGNLMANVSMTARGRQSVEDKEFRYFSIEYTDDYVDFQFEEEEGEDGTLTEKETKISHGPTVLGGGLTNRPFIKGMLPVSLSEDGKITELEEIIEDNNLEFNKEVTVSMKTLEELLATQVEAEARIKELEDANSKKKADKEELTALTKSLEEISADIKKLQKDVPDKEEKNVPDTKSFEELEETRKALAEANKKLEDEAADRKKLSDDVKTLSDTVKSLMESNKVLNNDKHKAVIEKRLSDLKDIGVFPATIKVIEKIAFSEPVKKFSITLSEGEGDAKKDITKTFMDIAYDILESIPKEHRFTADELSESVTTPTGRTNEASVEDVEKYALEQKVTFEEALIHFSREGKISE